MKKMISNFLILGIMFGYSNLMAQNLTVSKTKTIICENGKCKTIEKYSSNKNLTKKQIDKYLNNSFKINNQNVALFQNNKIKTTYFNKNKILKLLQDIKNKVNEHFSNSNKNKQIIFNDLKEINKELNKSTYNIFQRMKEINKKIEEKIKNGIKKINEEFN